jgi:hypothetical protein
MLLLQAMQLRNLDRGRRRGVRRRILGMDSKPSRLKGEGYD